MSNVRHPNDTLRRQYAEHLRATCGLQSEALVRALATVARERFLPPGPWFLMGEGAREGQQTTDADPRHVYANVSVAIDRERGIFNGAPGTVAPWIDALAIRAGDRVLQIGAGLGYYTAVLAHCVGARGKVVAYEIDEQLVSAARNNLSEYPWIELRHGDGRDLAGEHMDAILVHAGVTHPEPCWMKALGTTGRLVLPLTCTFPQLGPLGKGYALLITPSESPDVWNARLLGMIMIYSAVGLRNEAFNADLGRALLQNPMPQLRLLRCDSHERTSACWFHQESFCLSLG